jgi:SpoIVB peptidase S55
MHTPSGSTTTSGAHSNHEATALERVIAARSLQPAGREAPWFASPPGPFLFGGSLRHHLVATLSVLMALGLQGGSERAVQAQPACTQRSSSSRPHTTSDIRTQVRARAGRAPAWLAPGARGYGCTVFKGTQVERFPIEVLGVVPGVLGGSDMVLIRVTGGYPAEHGVGIIAGMSGSPIYVQGHLIGALAYGWAFSKEPVGGVTLLSSMLDELPASGEARAPGPEPAVRPGPAPTVQLTRPLHLGERTVRRICVTPQPARGADSPLQGDTLLMTPVGAMFQARGFSHAGLAHLRAALGPLQGEPLSTHAPSSTARRAHAMPRMQPGAAVGVQLLSGDLELAATGTLTYLQGKRFLAFGHPLAGLGEVTLPVSAACIEDILPSYQRPFKFSSQLGLIGQLSSDRYFSVGGWLGTPPTMIPVEVTVRDHVHDRVRTLHLRAAQHKYLTSVVLAQALAEAVASKVPAGSEMTAHLRCHLVAHGHEPLDIEQTVTGSSVTASLSMRLADYLSTLTANEHAPLTLDAARVEVDLHAGIKSAIIERLYTTKSTYRRGERIDVHVVLRPYRGARFEKIVQLVVPSAAERGPISLGVCGGDDIAALRKRLGLQTPTLSSLGEVLERLSTLERSNQLIVRAVYGSRSSVVDDGRYPFLPAALREVLPALPAHLASTDKDFTEQRIDLDTVVHGAESLSLEPGAEASEPSRLAPALEGRPALPAVLSPSPTPSPRTGGGTLLANGLHRLDLSSTRVLEAGTFERCGRDASGALALAPSHELLAAPEGRFVWTVLQQGEHTWVGGSHGSLMQLQGRELRAAASFAGQAVTALAPAEGGLWVATSLSGKVYRYTPTKRPELICDTRARYVWKLLPEADGSVLVATGLPARLLRVHAKGRYEVLAELSAGHLRSLDRRADGSLLLATATPGSVLAYTGSQLSAPLYHSSYGSVDGVVCHEGGAWSALCGKQLLHDDGHGQRRLITVSDKPLLSLAKGPGGTLRAGGADAHVYEISPDLKVRTLAQQDEGLVTSLSDATATGTLAGFGAPGRVLSLSRESAPEGTWTSEPLDAGASARWSHLRWLAGHTQELTIRCETRSGPTSTVDDAWSSYARCSKAAEGLLINSPPNRYLQVRVRLAQAGAKSSTKPDSLAWLQLFYRLADLPLQLELVKPLGGERLHGRVNLGLKVRGSQSGVLVRRVRYSADQGHTFTEIKERVVPTRKAASHDLGAEHVETSPLEELAWNTRDLKDGVYQLQVQLINPSSNTVVAEEMTAPFVVCNTPPEIQLLPHERKGNGSTLVRARILAHTAELVEVAYRQGREEWQVLGEEGWTAWNDRHIVEIDVRGTEDVEIRATDEAGNQQTVTTPVR